MEKKGEGLIRKLIFFLIIFLGLGVLNYPYLSSQLHEKQQQDLVAGYTQAVSQMSEEESQQLMQQVQEYNESLTQNQSEISDAFSEEKREREEALLLQMEDGILGHIKIEKIDVDLPIYMGTSADILLKGVGLLEGSSLPTDAQGVHTVLAGHSGLHSQRMFTDLEQLEIGDTFSLFVLRKELVYKVDQILTVEPWQTEALAVEPDKNMATLITCVPYGVNSHRLLVRGQLVVTEPEAQAKAESKSPETLVQKPEQTAELSPSKTEQQAQMFQFSCIILFAVGVVLLLTEIAARRKKSRS